MTRKATILIKVFSKKAAEEVTIGDIIDAFGAADYSEVEAMPGYTEIYNRIRKAKLKLEQIAKKYTQVENQALQCLAALFAERGRYRQPPDVFRETEALIHEYLYPHWGDIQPEYDARCKVIGEWCDVFVSYTNRDSHATNQRYANLVKHEWGRGIDPAVTTSNFIAATIAKYLQQNNLRCFFDYDNLQCGDDIEDEIRKHSSSAVAFVQLLEPQIFVEPAPPKRNWCKEEFEEFSRSQPPRIDEAEAHNRYFFILARGEEIDHILPARQPTPYVQWIEKASRKLHLTLNNYQSDYDGLRIAVRGIAGNILDAHEKIIDAMLSSW